MTAPWALDHLTHHDPACLCPFVAARVTRKGDVCARRFYQANFAPDTASARISSTRLLPCLASPGYVALPHPGPHRASGRVLSA
jgi:hypothetical protein